MRHAHDRAVDLWLRLVGGGAEIVQIVEDRVECAGHLDPREMLADADMRAASKGEVRDPLAEDVELVGILEDLGIAIGRAGDEIDERALGNLDAAKLCVPRRHAKM